MTDRTDIVQRQAAWQRSRRSLSWPEKVRLAAAIRPVVMALRRRAPGPTGVTAPPGTASRSHGSGGRSGIA
jgi:hypothetical protein